ncbi:MAG TPA: VOC family protein [Polyangia bacterium]|nr:VOC family protein [Polyangia bacterium]
MAAKAKKKAKTSAKKAAKKKASSKVTRKAKPAAKSARAKAKPAAKPARAAKPAKAAAPLYSTVTPVLTINGADAAIDFYKQAFGAKQRGESMRAPDGKIMHAEILIGDSVVMVNEAIMGPATKSKLHIYVPDCDAVYSQALAAGAATEMPLQDMFWGDRYGTVTDPYGNSWGVATHKEDVPPDEMQRRMEAMPPPGPPPAAA